MKRKKTSKSVFRTARINPIHAEEAKALEIIERFEAQNYSFKQIAVDAILRADGHTPEMFGPRLDTSGIIGQMEALLESFAREIIGSLKHSGAFVADDESGGDVDEYAKNFARGFMQRQRKAQGDK